MLSVHPYKTTEIWQHCTLFKIINHKIVTDLKNIINDPLNSSVREQKFIKLKNKVETVVNEGGSKLKDILEPNNFSMTQQFLIVLFILSQDIH
ncbi:unnamed protein product [Aphis gossypii]|uniref:Uncharacterized protein n=1 Tax=Aphis gossypii TaxID=80765 RepID=A0A9P0JBD8_APHGO|nr:unnamed protein product [Aphis gossypii]